MSSRYSNTWTTRISRLPLVTLGIITANLLVAFLARHQASDFPLAQDYGLLPSQLSFGRMFTANFVHDGFSNIPGFVHLSMNMFLLYLLGRRVEQAMGKLEFAMFYVGACFAASIMHVAIVYAALPPLYAGIPVIGASGAVAGVMGVYAVRFHRRVFHIAGMDIPVLFLVTSWLFLQLCLGVFGLYSEKGLGLDLRQVGYWSHLGGFTFGIVIALIANMALDGEREHLYAEAQRHYEEGNLLGAARCHESLLKYDPDNAFAHAELGRLWALLEEDDQSLPYYQNAVSLYVSQGREEEALERAEEMKGFWPQATLSAPISLRFALYLEETGQPEAAVRAFREIVDKHPETLDAQMSLLKIGQVQLSALRNPAEASETLRGFLDRYPTSEWRKFAEQTLARAQDVIAHSGASHPLQQH